MENKYDIVHIEWEDSRQSDPAWQWIEDYQPQEVCICRTIGYLIDKSHRAHYVAQTITDDNQMAGVITIPCTAIKSKTTIKQQNQNRRR